MANSSGITTGGDQIRSSGAQVDNAAKPANLQYRVTNIRSYDRPQQRQQARRPQRA